MIVNWSILTRSPAYSDEFVELGFLDYIALISIIGVADAFSKCIEVDVQSLEVSIELR